MAGGRSRRLRAPGEIPRLTVENALARCADSRDAHSTPRSAPATHTRHTPLEAHETTVKWALLGCIKRIGRLRGRRGRGNSRVSSPRLTNSWADAQRFALSALLGFPRGRFCGHPRGRRIPSRWPAVRSKASLATKTPGAKGTHQWGKSASTRSISSSIRGETSVPNFCQSDSET